MVPVTHRQEVFHATSDGFARVVVGDDPPFVPPWAAQAGRARVVAETPAAPEGVDAEDDPYGIGTGGDIVPQPHERTPASRAGVRAIGE